MHAEHPESVYGSEAAVTEASTRQILLHPDQCLLAQIFVSTRHESLQLHCLQYVYEDGTFVVDHLLDADVGGCPHYLLPLSQLWGFTSDEGVS